MKIWAGKDVSAAVKRAWFPILGINHLAICAALISLTVHTSSRPTVKFMRIFAVQYGLDGFANTDPGIRHFGCNTRYSLPVVKVFLAVLNFRSTFLHLMRVNSCPKSFLAILRYQQRFGHT